MTTAKLLSRAARCGRPRPCSSAAPALATMAPDRPRRPFPRPPTAPTSSASPPTSSRGAPRAARARRRPSSTSNRSSARPASSPASTAASSSPCRSSRSRRTPMPRWKCAAAAAAWTCATATTWWCGPGVRWPESRLRDAALVFAGYGIVAPEYGWNDYAGLDVRGKVVPGAGQRPGLRHPGPGALHRQLDDLLRPLDLQVRGSGPPGGGRIVR